MFTTDIDSVEIDLYFRQESNMGNDMIRDKL